MRRDLLQFLLPTSRLQIAVGLLVSWIVLGTAGYMILAGMSVVDALYQTVTTLSTVGFRELKDFDTGEKLFTVVLILGGVGTALYTLTLVIQEAVEGDIRSRLYLRRMRMRIEELSNHNIICGFGRVGAEVAREFRERDVPFVVVEQTPEQAARARAFGYLVIEGDASDDRVLNEAGIARARSLLAASDSDAGNTYITLTAKSMNLSCYVVARVGYPHNEEKLRLAGADRVLSLYTMGGRRMVLSALQPLAADFMDTIAAGRHGDLVLAEFEVNEENRMIGRSVKDLFAGTRNATLLGIRERDGGLIVGPRGDHELHEGDIAIVLADEADIARLVSPDGGMVGV